VASLQDQSLRTGLVDKNIAKQVRQDKVPQKNVVLRTGNKSVDTARLAELEVRRKNAGGTRELSVQLDAVAYPKAVSAQIKTN
jgi:hypothetical protein